MGRESGNGFTPTEKRIMAVLNDWLPHTRTELKNAIDAECPENVDDQLLSRHLSNIREKLEPRCQGIMYTAREGVRYQLVRTMTPAYEDMTEMGRDGTEE